MKSQSIKRRRFIKASLAVPILANIPWTIPYANATSGNRFLVPENIQNELVRIYGEQANNIVTSDRLNLKTPEIAENGAVVPIRVTGDKGLVSSMALFVANNPKLLVSKFTLHAGADLGVSLRIKVAKTSDVYLVAQTQAGLIGARRQVKVTIGCGGG